MLNEAATRSRSAGDVSGESMGGIVATYDNTTTSKIGDREKPGATRVARLILVYYVPPNRCHAGIIEAEAIQSSPGFSWSP